MDTGFARDVLERDGFRYQMAPLCLLVRSGSTDGLAAFETLPSPSTEGSAAIG